MTEKEARGTQDEARFISAMRRIREIKGLSQGDMAARMTEAGWDGFRQTTISRIEKGERTVRLAEAHAIAEMLGLTFSRMMDEAAQDPYAQRIDELDNLIGQLTTEIAGHREKLVALERMIAHAREEKQDLRARLASNTLATKLAEADWPALAIHVKGAATADDAKMEEIYRRLDGSESMVKPAYTEDA